ncbi:MAG: hypothetical protein ABW154_14145 [Dyella sp.]
MAGVKGKSGGARKGAGGARPGAGRPKKKPSDVAPPASAGPSDLLQRLEDIAFGRVDATVVQVNAAKAVLPFRYARIPEAGKKGAKGDAASKAAGGKFGAAAPPLRLIPGGK